MGRLSISVPVAFERTSQSHRFRGCDIEEFVWRQNSDHEQNRNDIWNARLAKIRNLRKPDGVNEIIIEHRDFSNLGKWSQGVFYYGDRMADDEGYWDILVDTGSVGVVYKYDGMLKAKVEMLNWVLDIAKAYRTFPPNNPSNLPPGNKFYTKHGAINLPFIEQEKTDACFYDHSLDLRLKISMKVTHVNEQSDEGLLGRTAAALATGYSAGVDIEKIRFHKKELSGLKGEEQVLKMTNKNDTDLDFTWRFAGEKNSGERPMILITMETPDGNLEEKLKIWDAILDSFKPMYKTEK
jgi:hypothetical protein